MAQTLPHVAGAPPSGIAEPVSLSTSSKVVNLSAIFFAVVQSVCTAFIALSGVRLLIGVAGFAAATGVLRVADHMHVPAIRIPMMLVALVASLWNLAALQRVWSLRRNPASAWRQRPVPKQKQRSEFIQFAISVLTLALLAVEAAAHYHLFHHL